MEGNCAISAMGSALRFRLSMAALAVLFAALTTPQNSHASSLTVFRGQYGGHFAGVLVIAQGSGVRLVAGANIKVSAGGKAAKFTIKGSINNAAYTQTISLSGGKATLNTIIPGGGGDFSNSATGTFSAHGRSIRISIPNPGGDSGSMTMTIGFINGGSTLSIQSIVTLLDGDPVYTTIVGA